MRRFIAPILVLVCLMLGMIFSYYTLVNDGGKDNKSKVETLSSYNNPYVPDGFIKIETERASWKEDEKGNIIGYNNGLVIEDELGNQFVWVPVMKNKIDEDIKSYFLEEELQITEREKQQIAKYGGFYIGRYESGINEGFEVYNEQTNNVEGIPVSMKNSIPWNYITLKNAKNNAQGMYKSNESVDSDLPTVLQYAYIAQWLKDTGIDIHNCKEYGNFVNSTFEYTGYSSTNSNIYTYFEKRLKLIENVIVASGSSEYTNLNNIYDLAGNLEEYTDTYISFGEYTEDLNTYERGGYPSFGGRYNETSGDILGVSYLGDKTPLPIIGYRVVLYNK